MKKNVEIDSDLIKKIIEDKNLTQKRFAELIGKDKQHIWFVVNNKRGISKETQNAIRLAFPEYFDRDNSIEIKYCPDIILPYTDNLNSNSTESVFFDIRLLPEINGKKVNNKNCMIVSIGSDNLLSFSKGSKVILDTSYKEFINDHIFAFTFGNNCYIRRISINPDGNIKCIPLNDNEDTFYIYSLDDKTNILGLIIPQIRL